MQFLCLTFIVQTSESVTRTLLQMGFCYTSSLVVLTVSFRTSRFPGASRSQPGGHEEQECSESGRHPTGYETLPVSPELLRAGNHTRCLHPRRCSGPCAFHFGENNETRVKMSLLAFKGYHLFISVLLGSPSCGQGLPFPGMCQICPPV